MTRWLVRLEPVEQPRFGDRPTVRWYVRAYIPEPGYKRDGLRALFGRRGPFPSLRAAHEHARMQCAAANEARSVIAP